MQKLLAIIGLSFASVLVMPFHVLARASQVEVQLRRVVVHQSDIGAGYSKVYTGASTQPLPETGYTWDRALWNAHGYLGGWGAEFGHHVPGTVRQIDSQLFSDADLYSTPANAHWAFERELLVYHKSPPLRLPGVGDESAAYGPAGKWTAVAFRRGRFLCLIVGNGPDAGRGRALSLALLMDVRAQAQAQ